MFVSFQNRFFANVSEIMSNGAVAETIGGFIAQLCLNASMGRIVQLNLKKAYLCPII